MTAELRCKNGWFDDCHIKFLLTNVVCECQHFFLQTVGSRKQIYQFGSAQQIKDNFQFGDCHSPFSDRSCALPESGSIDNVINDFIHRKYWKLQEQQLEFQICWLLNARCNFWPHCRLSHNLFFRQISTRDRLLGQQLCPIIKLQHFYHTLTIPCWYLKQTHTCAKPDSVWCIHDLYRSLRPN